MLRWIDTHNHLFVLSEEQQKKEVWEALPVGVVSLWCARAVSIIWKMPGAVRMNKTRLTRAAFIRFTSDLHGKKI